MKGVGKPPALPNEKYKYLREDFGEMPLRLHHLTMYINFLDDRVEAENRLEMTAASDLDRIELDVRDLGVGGLAESRFRGPSGCSGARSSTAERCPTACVSPRSACRWALWA